jgi:hypothetical protein
MEEDKKYEYKDIINLYKKHGILRSQTKIYEVPTLISEQIKKIFTKPNQSENHGLFVAPTIKPDLSLTENIIIAKYTKSNNNNIKTHRVGIILLDEINTKLNANKKNEALINMFQNVYAQTIQANDSFEHVRDFKIIENKIPENPSPIENPPQGGKKSKRRKTKKPKKRSRKTRKC